MGFFITSTSPVGMQYAAEITQPTPEGTSNGLIQLFGQASVVFVYIMEAIKAPDGSFTPALLLMVGLLLGQCFLDHPPKRPRLLKEGGLIWQTNPASWPLIWELPGVNQRSFRSAVKCWAGNFRRYR